MKTTKLIYLLMCNSIDYHIEEFDKEIYVINCDNLLYSAYKIYVYKDKIEVEDIKENKYTIDQLISNIEVYY